VQGFVANRPGLVVLVAYPLIPWIGVTAAGFALGPLLERPRQDRRRLLLWLGLALTAASPLLRALNVYGDPVPWGPQRSAMVTALIVSSTRRSIRRPLLFLLMTLGPALVLLRAFDRPPSRWLRPVQTFGRVPMFYFVVHFVMIHAFAVAVCWLRYGGVHWMFESPDLGHFPITEPPGLATNHCRSCTRSGSARSSAMYPLCRWYESVKTRSTNRWLSYF
jgi:hypothetical protein